MQTSLWSVDPRLAAVRGRVGRLGEVYRRGVDDTGRGLRDLERPQQLRRRGRRGPRPAACGTPARGYEKNGATPTDVHGFPLATERPDRGGRRPTAHHARANRENSRLPGPVAIPRRSTTPSHGRRPRRDRRRSTAPAASLRTGRAPGRPRWPAVADRA